MAACRNHGGRHIPFHTTGMIGDLDPRGAETRNAKRDYGIWKN